MKTIALIIGCFALLLAACSNNSSLTSSDISLSDPVPSIAATITTATTQQEIVLPIAQYGKRRTVKVFGQYIRDRFTGYHVGDDIEYADVADDVPVYAIADGTVEVVQFISGYGGVIRLQHSIEGNIFHSIYGHIALQSSSIKPGDLVKSNQFLANLGKGDSRETDGERKHLHFALYAGTDKHINGYESSSDGLKKWIRPIDFFADHQVSIQE